MEDQPTLCHDCALKRDPPKDKPGFTCAIGQHYRPFVKSCSQYTTKEEDWMEELDQVPPVKDRV